MHCAHLNLFELYFAHNALLKNVFSSCNLEQSACQIVVINCTKVVISQNNCIENDFTVIVLHVIAMLTLKLCGLKKHLLKMEEIQVCLFCFSGVQRVIGCRWVFIFTL